MSVDFRNPEAFYQDINSVVGLLKQFFRDLPEPLMTHEYYQDFVDAARTCCGRNSSLTLDQIS